ncbi:S41 family peptidase [Agaribacter marinus]|uniref:Tail specific protease domain-containing protein n=1 Tax=Agaribacter marinus TaxID=1431249 RepID=A0AA37WIZ3_9ALTE|nr:S41 family peptidase [Agaribacter marinus]GLR71598.1 hypothetical protein GCM10007852_25060 [Agaribacter marinus]
MMHYNSKRFLSVILAVAAVSITACNSKSKNKTDPIPDPNPPQTPIDNVPATNGLWHSQAYGMVLDVKSDAHQFYQITNEYCQTADYSFDSSALIDSISLTDSEDSMEITFAGLKVPGVVMQRIKDLPDQCLTDIVANDGEDSYVFDAQRDFEIFWANFNEYYAFFHLEGIDWDETYQWANDQINDNTTEAELFEILAKMIEPLKDFHVSLENIELDEHFSVDRKPTLDDIALVDFIAINQIHPPFSDEQIEAFEEYLQEAEDTSFTIIQSYFDEESEIKINDSDTIAWTMLNDNIGYINIATMDIVSIGVEGNTVQENRVILSSVLDRIVEDLKDTAGIIIDIRYNEGGDDLVGQMFAERFFPERTQVYSKQARLLDERTPLQTVFVTPVGETILDKPTAILTSSSTSSAAESFALSMREHDKSILVGEATAGGLSDTLPKSLPHGTIYSISNEFYLSVDGISYEGLGIPVGIEQAFFTRDQLEGGVDLGLEKAHEWILAQ